MTKPDFSNYIDSKTIRAVYDYPTNSSETLQFSDLNNLLIEKGFSYPRDTFIYPRVTIILDMVTDMKLQTMTAVTPMQM